MDATLQYPQKSARLSNVYYSIRWTLWHSDTATGVRRWSIFLATAIALFWTGYFFIKGEVPAVNGISRWWDITAGLLFPLYVVSAVGLLALIDKFIDEIASAIAVIVLFVATFVALGAFYEKGVTGAATVCLVGLVTTIGIEILYSVVALIIAAIDQIRFGDFPSLGDWLFLRNRKDYRDGDWDNY